LILRLEADFKRKGKGLIRAVCNLDQETSQTLNQVRTHSEGKVQVWVPVTLLDAQEEVITEVRFLISVKRFVDRP
jgi:hypothetical protein